jgi:Cap4 SAVED domain
MEWIEEAIQNLLIKGEGEIFSRIETIGVDLKIDGTEAKAYCYGLKLDAQGNPRVNDLVDFVATKLIDYSIPKKLQDEAKDQLNNTGSTSKIIELSKKAKHLFTDLEKTGEFGEMLLYILVQEILELPQLISKMSLKTSGQLHYQGADGIHVKYDSTNDNLSLYWGESKMEQTIYSGVKNCFDSLKSSLLDTYGHDSTQTRDLQLITSNISENINNPDLENILVRYFDLDDDLSNKLKYKGICFVGFDSDNYPSAPMEKTTEDIIVAFRLEMTKWLETSGKQIKRHINLEKFEIHLFLIPFPSVQEFRTHFLRTIAK